MVDYTGIARDPAAPMKDAVAALAARPCRGSVATPTAHPLAAVLAARGRVAAPTGDAVVPDRRVGVAECRRVLVEDEVAARRLALRRIGRDQR